MTVEEKFTKALVDNGMFPNQAAEVMTAAKSSEILADMGHRWSDNVERYPPQLFAVVWMTIRHIALEWIDANVPLAWYRPVFEDAK